MTKKVFTVLAIAAAMFSCTKEITNDQQPEEAAGGRLIVRANSPSTKLTFTDNGAGGYSVTFQDGTDHLWGYFRNGASQLNYINNKDEEKTRMFMELDESTLSVDHKRASFTSDCKQIPAEATNIFFYLDNNVTPITYNSTPTFCNLTNQSGTIADANLLHVIVGNTEVASMTTDSNGDKIADITFEYKTSVIKLELTFPEEIVPTADENTVITLGDANTYNKVHVSWGEPGSSSTKGIITTHPCSVAGQVATAYITVWEGTKFDSTPLIAQVYGQKATVLLSTAAVDAGKVYRLARTLVYDGVEDVDKWADDSANSFPYAKSLIASPAVAWLHYDPSTGDVSWDENTDGEPRTGSIDFSSSTVTVTQLEPKDFKGEWTLTSQRFKGANKLGYTSANPATNDVVFADPLSSAPRYDSKTKRSIPNNIGITGLYSTAIMDAVVYINYVEKSAQLGLFFDATSAQSVSTGDATYTYAAFLPELGGAFVAGAYNFVPYPLGTSQNYGWLWMSSNSTFDEFKYYFDNRQTWGVSGSISSKIIIGISINVSKLATPTSTSFRGTANGSTNYELIYQANAGGNVNTGMYFTRK